MLVHVVQSVLYTVYIPSMYEMEPVLAGLETPKPSQIPTFDYNLRLIFTITIIWWFGLWLVKLAVLAFYWRLFDSVRTHARLFWWFMSGVTISTFVVAVFLQSFACKPLGSFYQFGKRWVVEIDRWAEIDTGYRWLRYARKYRRSPSRLSLLEYFGHHHRLFQYGKNDPDKPSLHPLIVRQSC